MLRFLSFGLLATHARAANWAVLIAGSKSYSNYRHQADVCHSYAVVRSKGIPEENIILMMYDDVVNSLDNPFPGQLFNAPDGPDVYAICGSHIDYRGDDVTPENFVGVLTGEGSGKVLRSTEDDNVFVFFSDHGAPGMILFPNDALHQQDLTAALQKMSDAKMFNKLAFFLEACESGSMFEMMQVPGVYALSAAGVNEPSWGQYCGRSATVNGENLNTCLADMFSVAWMEDADSRDITQESLGEQFSNVWSATRKSEVSQWSDTTFQSDMVSEYLGSQQAPLQAKVATSEVYGNGHEASHIDLRRFFDWYEHQKNSTQRLLAGLRFHLEMREQLLSEHVFRSFAEIAYPGDNHAQHEARTRTESAIHKDCEMEGHRSFRQHCAGQFDASSQFALGFHQIVVNVCTDITELGMNLDIKSAAQMACEHIGSQSDETLFGTATRPAKLWAPASRPASLLV